MIEAELPELLLDGWSATVFCLPAAFRFAVHFAHEPLDNERAGDAFGLRVEIRKYAMRENGLCNRFQIFHAHEVTALQHRVSFGTAN